MNTISIAAVSFLLSLAGGQLHANELSVAQLAHQLDPPARVLLHLERAQALAAAGELERALDQVDQGLSLPRDSGASAYDQARLELWAMQWREREVLQRIAAVELDLARDLLLRMSEPLQSSYAQQRLELLESRLDEAEAQARRGKSSKEDRIIARNQRRAEAGGRLLDLADAELAKARSASNRTVYSARRAAAALRHSQEVERSVARWLREQQPDRSMVLLLALQMQAADKSVHAMLQLAEARTTQGDFREALTWVGRVLQQAPTNEAAKELRRTIQIASAASAGWLGGFGPLQGAPPR